jgi:thiazole synthase
MSDILKIGKYEFNSRLIVGSGKYDSFQTTKDATLASGSELITVAIRRVNITNPNEENLLDYFKDTNVQLLPNSAGCFTAQEAITTFRLMREATGIDLIKLEVIGDADKTLYPDVIDTIKACEVLKKDGFTIMAYTNAGVGCASDAAIAMELGAEAVLTNTAIAQAKDPLKMAEAMKHAVIAGRMGYKAGRIPKKPYATASSPVDGLIQF